MSILFAVVGGILLILVHALIEIPIIWVGEIVLFIVSFGRHKPRWDCYTYERGSDFAFLSEMSFWIGFVALCGMGLLVQRIFSSGM